MKLEDLTILYAEDENGIQETVSDVLELYVNRVISAQDGQEALDLYKLYKPSILLLDICMPKKDGLEVLKEIRAHDISTPVIIMTAHTEQHYLMNAVELYITKYLVKPFDKNSLLSALDECIKVMTNKTPDSIKLGDDCQDLLIEMQKVSTFIESNKQTYFPYSTEQNTPYSNNKKDDEKIYRFDNGLIPSSLKNWAEDISELSKKSLSHINKLYNFLMESVKDGDTQMYLAEPLLAEAGFLIQRLENLHALWSMYAKTDSEKGAPMARWLEITQGKRQDYLISASPIEVGFTLENMLWSKCDGAVLCSATLLALNSFDHFRFQSGLRNDDGSQYQQVTSPFDYQNNAQLVVAKMANEPSALKFTDELIEKLPQYIEQGRASLVLFSSYWQMEKVAEVLRDKNKLEILIQGEHSRQYIIDTHKDLCDKDKNSIVFGTQSFSEGLDLPGKYLTNLIITKLPFSVPTSPVEQAQAEYVTVKGGNPFMSLSVPETSKKLVQATGRLLRNEQDEGVITIMDKRLVTKRYGKQLLDSLPPFERVIE